MFWARKKDIEVINSLPGSPYLFSRKMGLWNTLVPTYLNSRTGQALFTTLYFELFFCEFFPKPHLVCLSVHPGPGFPNNLATTSFQLHSLDSKDVKNWQIGGRVWWVEAPGGASPGVSLYALRRPPYTILHFSTSPYSIVSKSAWLFPKQNFKVKNVPQKA